MLRQRNIAHVLFRLVNRFLNRARNVSPLSHANTDAAMSVPDNDGRPKCEPASTFYNARRPPDIKDLLVEIRPLPLSNIAPLTSRSCHNITTTKLRICTKVRMVIMVVFVCSYIFVHS